MRVFNANTGQALVESLVVLSLLALLLQVLLETIAPLHKTQMSRIELARETLWRWRPNTLEDNSSAYAFAERANIVLAPLKALTGLSLEQENLRTITADEDYAAMARITDTWSPQAPSELYSRPAQLTPLSRLQDLGVGKVQDFISWLHFTEEFASDSLQFGYVASDATPSELPCQRGSRC
ncbi:hypothetical protein [Pseudidiomarina sp.]|uniref:hypothetical protein n=1 Tax=Pseudidiomarina sp. TaxID=2081707 RepID=UPI003A96FD70